MLALSLSDLNAQCLACFSSIESGQLTCKTELVNRDGHTSCGCDGGCNCSGECEFSTEPGEAFAPDFNFDEMNVPIDGYKIRFDEGLPKNITANFVQGGFIGKEKTDKVYFGSNVGFYQLSNKEFLFFPLENNVLKLKNCNGEIMANIIPSHHLL